MFLDSRDKSLNMIKICRNNQRKWKSKRRTKNAFMLRIRSQFPKTQFDLVTWILFTNFNFQPTSTRVIFDCKNIKPRGTISQTMSLGISQMSFIVVKKWTDKLNERKKLFLFSCLPPIYSPTRKFVACLKKLRYASIIINSKLLVFQKQNLNRSECTFRSIKKNFRQ